MPKITEIKKRKTTYDITFDEKLKMSFEPVIYMKYHLKLYQVIDTKQYEKIVNDNIYEQYKKIGLNRLKRLQTKKELYDYLIDKGAKKSIANQLIFDFSEKRYLDDAQYTKYYIELKKNQKGPLFLESELIKKGVPSHIIYQYLNKIDTYEILTELIAKKISLLSNKKSKKQIILKLKSDFMRLGFKREMVESVISKQIDFIPEVDINVIEKAYQTIRRSIKQDTLSYEDHQKIFSKLYQKGYPTDLIKEVISKNK
jgi:SOS response regulatory protein OraA/RecX